MSRLLDSLLHARRRVTQVKAPTGHATVVLRTLAGSRPAPRRSPVTLRSAIVVAGVAAIAVLAWLGWQKLPSFGASADQPSATGRPVGQQPTNSSRSPESTAAKPPAPAVVPQPKPAPATAVAKAEPLPAPPPPQRSAAEPRNAITRERPAMKSAADQVATPAPAVVTASQPAAVSGAGSADRAGDKPAGGVVRSNAPASDDAFRMAVYYHQAGDFANALVNYKSFLEKNELSVEGHNNLGLLYQGKGLHEDASREFRKAIAIDPKNTKAHNNLGVSLMQAGEVDAAVQEFRWLVGVDSKNVDAMVNLALALRAANRADAAKETLLNAVQVNPRHATAHYNLALLYEGAQELAKALEQYEYYLKYASADQSKTMSDVRARCDALRQQMVPR